MVMPALDRRSLGQAIALGALFGLVTYASYDLTNLATLEGILTVSEGNIIRAMRLLWERMKIVVEPSGAVPLAAVLEHPDTFAGRRVGLIISGGNVDLDHLPW